MWGRKPVLGIIDHCQIVFDTDQALRRIQYATTTGGTNHLTILLCLFALLLPRLLVADRVHLKNGTKITGKVTDRGDKVDRCAAEGAAGHVGIDTVDPVKELHTGDAAGDVGAGVGHVEKRFDPTVGIRVCDRSLRSVT